MPENPVQHDDHMQHPHPHDDHHEHDEHIDCPDHFHRCHTKTVSYGFMDCPHEHLHPKPMKNVLLTVNCGADDPKPQIQAYLNNPVNLHALVTGVLDLGHSGWLVIFTQPT